MRSYTRAPNHSPHDRFEHMRRQPRKHARLLAGQSVEPIAPRQHGIAVQQHHPLELDSQDQVCAQRYRTPDIVG